MFLSTFPLPPLWVRFTGSATNEKNKVQAALDAVLADEQSPSVVSPGDVLPPSPTTPAVKESASVAAATSTTTPEQSQESKQKLSDIDMWVKLYESSLLGLNPTGHVRSAFDCFGRVR